MSRVNIYCCGKVSDPALTLQVNSGASGTYIMPTGTGTFLYDVRTSDGQFFFGKTGSFTITFPAFDTVYTIEIRGTFPHMRNDGYAIINNSKIVGLSQFGGVAFTSMQRFLYNCPNVEITATDTPTISSPIVMTGAFKGCSIINFNLSAFGIVSNQVGNILQDAVGFDNDGQLLEIDVNGATNIDGAFQNIDVTNIRLLNCGSITVIDSVFVASGAFRGVDLIAGLELFGLAISIDVRVDRLLEVALLGTALNTLFSSLADLTGGTSKSVTMSSAQRASGIDETILTLKNWTIIEI